MNIIIHGNPSNFGVSAIFHPIFMAITSSSWIFESCGSVPVEISVSWSMLSTSFFACIHTEYMSMYRDHTELCTVYVVYMYDDLCFFRFPCAVVPCNHPLLGPWRAARVATQLHGLLQKDLLMSAESRVIGTFKKDSLNQIQWFFSNDEDSLPFVTSWSMVLFLMFCFFPSETWKADWFGLMGNPGISAKGFITSPYDTVDGPAESCSSW